MGAREFASVSHGRFSTHTLRVLACCLFTFAFCLGLHAAAPTDAEIRDGYHKSYRYEKAQNYPDAIKALAPIVAAYPQGYTVNLRLGWLNYLNGGFATARAHYQAAIKTAPDSLEAKLGHTLPLLAQEKWEEVESLTKQILRVDPANYTANLRLAFVSRLQKKFEAAEAILNGMLALYPTDISLLTELGFIKLAKDNKAEAKRLFNDVVTLDPENVTAKAQLSKL
jgi:tetratricopeptide (TPR) repeat protein